MNEEKADPDEQGLPWWPGGSNGLPDVESLLGPEGMAAVGGVADEALKLFVVLRDRYASIQTDIQAPATTGGSPWPDLLGQLASGAVRAVTDLATAVGEGYEGAAAGHGGRSGSETEGDQAAHVPPGEAAACSFCPICQAIALFRSVPMSTWQRLAASVVEAADAARDIAAGAAGAAGAATGSGGMPVVVVPADDNGTAMPKDAVSDFLSAIEEEAEQGDPQ